MKEFKKGQKVTIVNGGNASDFNRGELNIIGAYAYLFDEETVFEIEGTVKLITFDHSKGVYGAYLLKKDGVNVGYVYNTYLREDNSKLIAAAPELLKALLEVREILKKEWPKQEWDEFSNEETSFTKAINKALN
jgi:hypothetical protein